MIKMSPKLAQRLAATTMLSAGVVLLATPAAYAQAPAPVQAAAANDSNKVAEIVVTGSALRVAPDAVAVPVSTVSADQIQQSGVNANALEILRKSLPAFEGRGNTGNSNANNTNQNTAGGSQARLRDLDTLVLINGRRAAVSAIAGVGGKIFVDVNQIPPNALDRVEVLADGASAIYGSDAVGGVVNFILKQHQDGIEVGGRYGGAEGGYSESSAYISGGTRLADRFDVVLNAAYNHTDPLYQKDRSFTHPFFVSGAAIPGAVSGAYVLNTNLNSPSQVAPTGTAAAAASIAALVPGVYTAGNAATIGAGYDLSRFQNLLLRQNVSSLSGSLNGDLAEGGKLDLFGDFEYSHGESFTQFLPRVAAVNVAAGAPYNPTTGAVPNVQFGDVDNAKQYFNTTDKFRITAGLRGRFDLFSHDWRWEAAFTHSQDQLNQKQANVIYGPNLGLAVAGGFDANGNAVAGGHFSKVYSNFDTGAPLILVPALDPFARGGRDPKTLANVLGTERITGKSILDSADAKLTGNLFSLPGGPVSVAVGAAWREESMAAGADLNGRNTGPTAQRWIGGQFFDPFSKSRTIYGGFGEVRAPLTGANWNAPGLHALDLIGAVRVEHYSDAGTSTVPKIGLRWQPIDSQVTVRATYSKSFTAPSLYAEYGPTDTRQAGGAIIQTAFAGQPSSPFNAEDGNNPNLLPATADTFSLGAVIKPNFLPDFRLTLQYTNIAQKGIAGGIGFNNILVDVNRLGSGSIFYNNVAKNNFPGLPGAVGFSNPGDLLAYLNANPGVNNLNLYAIDQFRNLGGIKVSTVDVTMGYTWRVSGVGRFDLDLAGTYLDSYQYQALPSQPFYEFAGVASNSPQAGGTQPKWRSYTTLTWTGGPWTATLAHNYIDSVRDEGAGGFTFANSTAVALPVKSYTSIDARLAYRLEKGPWRVKDTTIAVGVTNIGNAMPPYAPNAFSDNRADVSTYSPIGRLIYGAIDLSF